MLKIVTVSYAIKDWCIVAFGFACKLLRLYLIQEVHQDKPPVQLSYIALIKHQYMLALTFSQRVDCLIVKCLDLEPIIVKCLDLQSIIVDVFDVF